MEFALMPLALHLHQTTTDAEHTLTELAVSDATLASKELKTNLAFIIANLPDCFYIYFFE